MRPASNKLKKDLYVKKYSRIQTEHEMKEKKIEFDLKLQRYNKIKKSLEKTTDVNKLYKLEFEKQELYSELKQLKSDYKKLKSKHSKLMENKENE